MFKLILVLVLVGFGYHHYSGKTAAAKAATSGAARVTALPGGFEPMPPLSGDSGASVVIFAPEDCPEDGAQRADALAAQLTRKGIPVTRSSNANFSFSGADPATIQRVQNVMTGEIPVVFVRGRGKANPTADEVLAAYRAGG